ncbi:hypothetical protein MPER_00058, partial [Moniliophthora perniciosa FA553]
SATTIEWLVIAMLAFPDVQRKVQAEIDAVIGQSRIPTLADMENLPYMRAVVKEVGIVVPPPNAFLTLYVGALRLRLVYLVRPLK